MPYVIQKSGDQYCVHKQMNDGGAGEKVACHPSKEEAMRHMRALYANVEHKSIDDDLVVFDGGAIKSLGDGLYGGYGILFTSERDPDIEREFFTKATEFELEDRTSVPVYWHHGLDPALKGRKLSKATYRVDEAGVWFETKLQERDEYEKYIKKLADMGKLGWSTGATSHLVQKKALSNAIELVKWPIGELSLDHRPVEPRTSAIAIKSLEEVSLKSLIEEEQHEPEVVAPVSLDGLPALKSLCDAVSPANLTMSEHTDVADAALRELLTHGSIFVDAFKGYRVRADRLIEFRFKKDGGHISAAKEESLKSWKEGLSELRKNIESLEGDIDGTLKLSAISRSTVDAAEKHSQFLMQQIANLNSILAKE